MEVHLVDGTYELFRHFYAWPSMRDAGGREVGAVKGVLASILAMVKEGATHLGVATDHVIESFRNDLWPGYKTGEGIDPDLWSQFPLLEEALGLMGIVVWPMAEFEADDALASAAALAASDAAVKRVLICTPDKDLAQCVRGQRVVQLDRRKRVERDEAGVVGKFGVYPQSIPDYLALVGDAADGFPGLRGWGEKSAAAVLSRFRHLERIPEDSAAWAVNVSNPRGLNATLRSDWQHALLFRDLATLRADLPLFTSVDQLQWQGPTPEFEVLGRRLDAAKVSGGKRGAPRRTAAAPTL
jgi:5'-3' exonuclease